MKARIHLHSFEALAFDLLVPEARSGENTDGRRPVSNPPSQARPKPSVAPPRPVPGWIVAAESAHPPGDPVASSSPLSDL